MKQKNDLHDVITGMASLGEIYLRITARLWSLYEQNPGIRFSARTAMVRAGYTMDEYDLRKMVDQFLHGTSVIPVTKGERTFLYHYAEQFNDPVLTQEMVTAFASGDREERVRFTETMQEQLSLFPDPSLGFSDLASFGYLQMDLFPVRKEIAMEILQFREINVYCIYSDGRRETVSDMKMLQAHQGMFGVKCEQWTAYYLEAFRSGRTVQFSFREPEKQYRIYQWKQDAKDRRDCSFLPYDVVLSMGVSIEVSHYDLMYESSIQKKATLDDIFEKFNLDRPEDFRGHSLSVSDVVAIEEDGIWACYYVDSFGFRMVEDFLPAGAEMVHVPEVDRKMTGGSRVAEIPQPKDGARPSEAAGQDMRAELSGDRESDQDRKDDTIADQSLADASQSDLSQSDQQTPDYMAAGEEQNNNREIVTPKSLKGGRIR